MRGQPALDRKERLLYIKIDLVAHFPQSKLSNVIRNVFKGLTRSNLDVWNVPNVLLPFLKGLRVRCCFITPTKDQVKDGERGLDLWRGRSSGDLDKGRVFQIMYIKWAHEVPKNSIDRSEHFLPSITLKKCQYTSPL